MRDEVQSHIIMLKYDIALIKKFSNYQDQEASDLTEKYGDHLQNINSITSFFWTNIFVNIYYGFVIGCFFSNVRIEDWLICCQCNDENISKHFSLKVSKQQDGPPTEDQLSNKNLE